MEIVKLGNIFDFSTGTSSLPKDYKNGNDILFINYKDVFAAKPIMSKTLSKIKILKNKDYSNKMVYKNDLVITSSSETSKDNGMVSIYSDNTPALLNGFSKKMVINKHFEDKIINKYIFYLLNTLEYRKRISNCSNGITRHNIIWNYFYKIEVMIIPLKDQQAIIDIMEPFEKEKYIRENMNRTLLELIKNHNANNVLDEKVTLNDLVLRTKKKNPENYQNVIDLSSINNDSLTFFSFKKTSDFNSNIFETKEGDLFLSSIRPSLKKYGISPFNMNILGTLFNFRPLIYENRGLILSCISSNNFQNFLIQSSEGTKMPIVKWDKFKDFKFSKINNNESLLFNNIFDFIKLNNQILNVLEKILNNLIELHIK